MSRGESATAIWYIERGMRYVEEEKVLQKN